MNKHHLALAIVYGITAITLLLESACALAICASAAGLIYAVMARRPADRGI